MLILKTYLNNKCHDMYMLFASTVGDLWLNLRCLKGKTVKLMYVFCQSGRIFSSSDTKGHVCYCHHCASAICPSFWLLTFHIVICLLGDYCDIWNHTLQERCLWDPIKNLNFLLIWRQHDRMSDFLFWLPETYESSLKLQVQKSLFLFIIVHVHVIFWFPRTWNL